VQLLNKIAAPAAAGQHATSRVRAAATAFFAFDGFIFATWAVRIPAVKAATGASPAELGVALLGVSGGAIATMALSGVLCRRFGAARVLICGAGWLSLSLLLPALARSAVTLGLGLLVFGIGYGAVNVAANTVAVDVVAALRRPVMPSFHAAWSLGGLAGAAVGGLLAPHLAPLPHFAFATLLGLAVTAVAGRILLTTALPGHNAAAGHGVPAAVDAEIGPRTAGPRTAEPGAVRPSARPHVWRVVLLLGVLAACATYGEGSISDWGALRLHGLGAGPGLAAIGYAAFALAEACGRLAGTWLLARFGQRAVLVSGGLATCAGMLCAALAPSIPFVVAGFALAGLGVANAFPAAMSRVGLLAGPHGVAIASTLGYGGFLLGPPAIGFLAGAVGLGPSLATVSVLALVSAALAWILT
jgi:MFS family permease